MKRVLLLLAVVAMVGCEPPAPVDALDQCQRNAIFERCMKLLPAGPDHPKYNDWAEVIDECEEAARAQSIRGIAHVAPACRSR